MNNIFTPELRLPFAMTILSMAIPLGLLKLIPDLAYFNDVPLYWFGTFLTLSMAIAAVRLTFNRLIVLNEDAKADDTFEFEEERLKESAILKAHAKTAQLIILGTVLLSIFVGTVPADLPALLLFTSLRIGAVLFLLGGIVMISTHFKMRKL